MANTGNFWKEKEVQQLITDYQNRIPGISTVRFCKEWGNRYNRGVNAVKGKIDGLLRDDIIKREIVRESPYPTYDEPLVSEGDAVILPDIEMPFHNADFLNRVLDLSQRWNIKQCIMAGDLLHFDSLSGWEPNWTNDNKGGLSSDAEKKLIDFAMTMGAKKQGEFMELIVNIGVKDEQDGVSTELEVARKELRNIEKLFDKVDFVMGNHCGRLLRALQTTLNPNELLRLLDVKNPKWRIAPYYFSHLDTVRGRYTIEHPKNAGKFSAGRLCSKYMTHILMAHSHQLNYTLDPSGTYYAIEMGHCVDETKLPYCAQRHNTSPKHSLGAVIVRDGFPYLLHPNIDWAKYAKM